MSNTSGILSDTPPCAVKAVSCVNGFTSELLVEGKSSWRGSMDAGILFRQGESLRSFQDAADSLFLAGSERPGHQHFGGTNAQCDTFITISARMFCEHETAHKRFSDEGCTKSSTRPRGASLRILALALACLFLPSAHAVAQEETPEDKGLRIAQEASARNDGFQDFTAGMTMVLRDRHGRESVRQMRFKVLEVPGDGDKSLFVFDQPRDVQGTALLTHAHVNSQDDQWLYLPALKRVKRINAARRSGSFMGSEFSYEDMSSLEVEEYTYKYLRDEPCGERTCTVIEQVPLDEESGYSRRVLWQDAVELRTWKMELYDRKGSHLKTLTFANYQQYLERYWRAGEQTMVNHLTGASTVLEWTDFRFRTNLAESEFTQTALRRVR